MSISCMNAGLSIPAEEIKGQLDAKILVPSVRICNEFQCNKKYIMFSIQSVCLPPDLCVILPGKLAAASLLEALSAENSKSDQKKNKKYDKSYITHKQVDNKSCSYKVTFIPKWMGSVRVYRLSIWLKTY